MEPSTTPPLQQRVSARSRDDVEQAVRSGARHTHQLLLLSITPSLRRVSRTRAALRGLEESLGRASY